MKHPPRAFLIATALILIFLLIGYGKDRIDSTTTFTSDDIGISILASGEDLSANKCNLRVHETFFQGIRNIGEVTGVGFFETEIDSGALTLKDPAGKIWTKVMRDGNTIVEYSPDSLKSRKSNVDQIPSLLNQSPGVDPLQIRDVYRAMSVVGLPQNLRTSFLKNSSSAVLEFIEFDFAINSIGRYGTPSHLASWEKYDQLEFRTLNVSVLWPIENQPVIKFDLPIATESELMASKVSIEASCIWQ